MGPRCCVDMLRVSGFVLMGFGSSCIIKMFIQGVLKLKGQSLAITLFGGASVWVFQVFSEGLVAGVAF